LHTSPYEKVPVSAVVALLTTDAHRYSYTNVLMSVKPCIPVHLTLAVTISEC